MIPPVQGLVALAVGSVILDIVGGLIAPELRFNAVALLLVGRVLLDGAVVAVLFVRRRSVWVALRALYWFAIAWRGLVLFSQWRHADRSPFEMAGACLLTSHLLIAVASVILLSRRPTTEYFR